MYEYSTNLTDNQRQVIEKIINAQEKVRKHSLRDIMNAILYTGKTGCQWRLCLSLDLVDSQKSIKSRERHSQLDETTLPVFAIKEQNEIIKEIKVFRKHVNTEDPVLLQACYRGDFIKHPNRNLVVRPWY